MDGRAFYSGQLRLKGSTHEAEVTDVENKAPEGESRAGEWKAVV